MTQELTTEQLNSMGFGSQSFTKYKTLTVDNGDDTNGTNKTGEFVVKVKEEGEFKREQFGKKLEGVILSIKAQVTSPYSENKNATTWFSDEFVQGDEIKLRKSGDAKNILFSGNYAEFKEKFSQSDGLGNTTKLYKYSTFIYINLNNEIVKLKLSGKSQGEWFEYQKQLKSKLLQVNTVFEIKVDEEKDNCYCTFTDGETAVFKENYETLQVLQSGSQVALEAPKQEIDTESIPVVGEEDEDDVKLDDVPF